MVEKGILLAVFAEVGGTDKCFGISTNSGSVGKLINDLDQQMYLIPKGRPMPVFRVEKLKPGERHLWHDGIFRQSTNSGEIIISPGKLRQR